jgi:hypothetical protein
MTLLGNGGKKTLKAGRKAAASGNRTTALQGGLPVPTGRIKRLRQQDEPLGDFAYRVLRFMIRDGKIVPGEHLREADVAALLNISRTPVREAFQWPLEWRDGCQP